MTISLPRYQMLIDVKIVNPIDGKIIVSKNPANEENWAEFPDASPADVNLAVQAAHHAFENGHWRHMPPAERGKRIRKFGELIRPFAEKLGRTETYSIVQNELFGPVLIVIKVDTEEHAIRLANATRYSFAGGVFTTNMARAIRLVRGIRAGRVWVNSYRTTSMYVPFGGFNESGYGRESGLHAVQDYTDTKGVFIDVSGRPSPDPFIMR